MFKSVDLLSCDRENLVVKQYTGRSGCEGMPAVLPRAMIDDYELEAWVGRVGHAFTLNREAVRTIETDFAKSQF